MSDNPFSVNTIPETSEIIENKPKIKVDHHLSNYSNVDSTKVEPEKRRKLRHSNFFITLNSNQPIQDIADIKFKELEKVFSGAVQGIFNADRIHEFIVVKEVDHSW